jgi:hypothetical protein
MRGLRYRVKLDWQTFVLIFIISLILYLLPFVKDLLIITAIAAVFYLFIKSLY